AFGSIKPGEQLDESRFPAPVASDNEHHLFRLEREIYRAEDEVGAFSLAVIAMADSLEFKLPPVRCGKGSFRGFFRALARKGEAQLIHCFQGNVGACQLWESVHDEL